MKKREPILINMEILASLIGSPKGPSRLGQACNINLTRIEPFINALLEKGLIRSEVIEKQTTYFITEAGYTLYRDWLEIWRRLPLV